MITITKRWKVNLVQVNLQGKVLFLDTCLVGRESPLTPFARLGFSTMAYLCGASQVYAHQHQKFDSIENPALDRVLNKLIRKYSE